MVSPDSGRFNHRNDCETRSVRVSAAHCVGRRCHILLFSAFKFVRRRSLEEHNPELHTLLGNVETLLRGLRIPDRKPSQEFILRHIKKVYFTAGSKSFRSQPVILTFFSCPKAEIENYIRSQFQRPARDIPEHSLD